MLVKNDLVECKMSRDIQGTVNRCGSRGIGDGVLPQNLKTNPKPTRGESLIPLKDGYGDFSTIAEGKTDDTMFIHIDFGCPLHQR